MVLFICLLTVSKNNELKRPNQSPPFYLIETLWSGLKIRVKLELTARNKSAQYQRKKAKNLVRNYRKVFKRFNGNKESCIGKAI